MAAAEVEDGELTHVDWVEVFLILVLGKESVDAKRRYFHQHGTPHQSVA